MIMTPPVASRLLIEGALNLVLGKPGAGKSFLAASLAADVTRGRDPLTGEPVRPGRALFLHGDDQGETVARRLFAQGAALDRLVLSGPLRSGLAEIPELAAALGGPALIVFDPLRLFVDSPGGLGALAAVLSWIGANGATALAVADEQDVSRELLVLSRTVFLTACDGARRFLAPLKHPALTRAMPFVIQPPLVCERERTNSVEVARMGGAKRHVPEARRRPRRDARPSGAASGLRC